MNQQFDPPWWLANSHVQSCLGAFVKTRIRFELHWEQLDLPDGDFIDLCWSGAEGNPIVILLHGLEGSVYSHYMLSMMEQLPQHGWHAVTLHFRGCSGRNNRLARSYHAGDIEDLRYFVDILAQRYPHLPIAAVGFSLGGNVLMKYLNHTSSSPLRAAVGVSVPFQIQDTIAYLPKFYRWRFLRTMKQKMAEKIHANYAMPITMQQLELIDDFDQYDEWVTVPLHGFGSVKAYYEQSTIRPLLQDIKHPTLLMHAQDDPFVPPGTVPLLSELSPSVKLEVTERGGHIGFHQGDYPWSGNNWLEYRIPLFLEGFKTKE